MKIDRILVAAVAIAALGCASPTSESAPTAADDDALRDFAVRYTAAWNSGDARQVAEHYAEDGWLKVNDADPAVGRAGVTEVATGFMTSFPDATLLFDGLERVDGRVNYHWTYVGTNTGPEGTGRRVRFSGFESWVLNEDGLVAESLGTFDADEYARQLADGVESYLYIWAGDPDETDSDFVAVIDASPDSDAFGTILATVPVGRSAGAHHSEHVMPEGGHLVVNGFRAGQSWVVDVRDPMAPVVTSSFTDAGPYSSPHSFDRTPSGNLLATFQYYEGDRMRPGGLVELDPAGNFLRGSDAADPVDPELHPYSLAIAPRMNRVVTTTSDMSMNHEGSSVQVWSLDELELLHTIPLPPGPRGDEHLNPAEPRFLDDGSAIVNTFNCGMYYLTAIDSDAPEVHFMGSLPRDTDAGLGAAECSLPVLYRNFWVQTSDPLHSIVVFDITDPRRPIAVDQLEFDAGTMPHWLSLERGTNRIVLTGGGDELAGMVVLLEIDRETGALSIVEDFGAPGAIGVSLSGPAFPHGETGPAIPHGAVFSR